MDLQLLRTFIAVAEAGSLTRAAEGLFLSQPAVSGQVKSLEATLGSQLFKRSGRGMVLTHAGEQLLVRARDIVIRTDGLARLAEQLRGDAAGDLHLGIVDSGYDLKLARIVGKMRQTHPDVVVHLLGATTGENIRSILKQDLDVAFAEGVMEDDRLHSVRIGTSRVGVIGPAAWAADLSHAGWAKLGEFPWVFQSEGCSYCRLMHQVSQTHHVDFEPQYRVEAFGAVRELVAEGLALSITDLNALEQWPDASKVFVWPQFEYAMPVHMIALKQRVAEPVIEAFLQTATAAHPTPPVRRRAVATGQTS